MGTWNLEEPRSERSVPTSFFKTRTHSRWVKKRWKEKNNAITTISAGRKLITSLEERYKREDCEAEIGKKEMPGLLELEGETECGGI